MRENINYIKYYNKFSVKNFSTFNKPQKSRYSYFIVIPAYNEYDYIDQTLQSIEKQSYQESLLVVVVINNSTNELPKIKRNNDKTFNKLNSTNYKFEIITIDCFSKKMHLYQNMQE